MHWPLRRLRRFGRRSEKSQLTLDALAFESLKKASEQLFPDSDDGAIKRAQKIVDHQFSFLNHTEILAAIDWRKSYVSHLWTYHLHYFDYARDLARAFRETKDSRYVAAFESLVSSWIEQTAQKRGDGWEPYPVSVRVINWIQSLLVLDDALSERCRSHLTRSLQEQLSFLESNLEWHLLANHLQKNLCALFLGGLIFRGSRAERWRANGAQLLWKQVAELILPDGGHAERSPMYHAIAIRDLVEAVHYARAAGEQVPAEAVSRVAKLASSFGVFTRDDSNIHLFNDSANGIAPSPSSLSALTSTVLNQPIMPPIERWELPATGFYGFRDLSSRGRLIIDCGNPGPSYQPGHAHCGLLSYELDLADTPVIVDSGLHGYDNDPYREYVRSTRAHNTVSIGGKDQSEMWGTFRVARRAKVVEAHSAMEDGGFVFRGAYRPYHDRQAVHHRTLRRTGNGISIDDVVSEASGVVLESFLHFHPDFSVREEGKRFMASNGTLALSIEPVGVDSVSVQRGERDPVQAWYCPEFGKAIPQDVIVFRVHRNSGRSFGYRIELAPTSA
jgi:hypothetical protein